ncbi:hypothetical protein TIFTF001_003870 [Ficus carica]|uniref:Uncharacterized protein n=1 Tax=Ficus carica TaxID=3494 RepID=A0AA87ZDJ0_FICCA|nr:hypothetical protein TIFTF001_003870 [Ficus carica]
MRTRITYELAGSKPNRNLELVIKTSCDASPATEVACLRKEARRKLFLCWWGLGFGRVEMGAKKNNKG